MLDACSLTCRHCISGGCDTADDALPVLSQAEVAQRHWIPWTVPAVVGDQVDLLFLSGRLQQVINHEVAGCKAAYSLHLQ